MPVPADFLAFAHELADAAGEVLRRYYRAPVEVAYKADESPVTTADREAERRMRDLIAARFPDHGIEGEEFASEHGDAELVWSLDPDRRHQGLRDRPALVRHPDQPVA